MRWLETLLLCVVAVLACSKGAGQQRGGTLVGEDTRVHVTTYHNDNARTGQNLHETILTPDAVPSAAFGRLFARDVDGLVQAQPLYVEGLSIPSKGKHNVVFVATQRNSVYAFDADDASLVAPLWRANLGTPAEQPYEDFPDYGDIVPSIGITGTPVIEMSTGTLYVVAFVLERVPAHPNRYYQMLHALDLGTGRDRPGSPIEIGGSIPGRGYDAVDSVVTFAAMPQLQRSGLLLSNGVLYVGFASHIDTDPYHGWLFGYRSFGAEGPPAPPLARVGIYATTPDNARGGIWMSGVAPAADEFGDVYFETGNNGYPRFPNDPDYSQSFVKLRQMPGALVQVDSFTPYNRDELDRFDIDLGSGGILLLPSSAASTANPHLLVGAGKEGTVYLLDRTRLGGFHPADGGADGGTDGGVAGFDDVVKVLPFGIGGGSFGCPAYFNGRVYYVGVGAVPVAFEVGGGTISSAPALQGSEVFEFPGATPSISSNGTSGGIVWTTRNVGIIDPDHGEGLRGVLNAYDAEDLGRQLYSSAASVPPQDYGYAKFSVPTVANGKVYVGTKRSLLVFGLR
jgi:hypothetical protein